MPAARHRSRSSFRERAVKAMTGKWPPADRSRSRIAWMTWKPSSSGMWTSRSSRSKASSSARDNASRPLFASRTLVAASHEQLLQKLRVEFVVLGHQDVQRCRTAGTGVRVEFLGRRGLGRRRRACRLARFITR